MGRLPAYPNIEVEQGIFFVFTVTTKVFEETDVERKEKNTVRQLLQPGSCLERGSLGRRRTT